MPTTSRATPHLVLAGLTVLALVALVFSANTAPANAQEQVQTAAKNTIAANSFVLTDTITVFSRSAAGTPQTHQEQARFVYHAPDQVQETVSANGRVVTYLVLGDRRYERQGSGKWTALPPEGTGVPVGVTAAQGLVQPLQPLTTVTDVVAHGDRYAIEPAQPQRQLLLQELLGTQSRISTSATSFSATVSGEFLDRFDMRADLTGGQVFLRLALGSFDRAPALVAPSGPGR